MLLHDAIDNVGSVADSKIKEQKRTKSSPKSIDTKSINHPVAADSGAEEDVSKSFGCVVVVSKYILLMAGRNFTYHKCPDFRIFLRFIISYYSCVLRQLTMI